MHHEVITVTPQLAQRWLEEKNNRNRSISDIKVSAYAWDMTNGRWVTTHQNAIAFYKDGNLADGQHRLAAIVKANASVDMLVWWGLADDAAYGIDAHRMRSTHDQIKIARGSTWISKDSVAIVRLMMSNYGAGDRVAKNASPQEISLFCEEHENCIKFVTARISKGAASAPVKAAVALAYYYEDHDVLSEWCDVMSTGLGVMPQCRNVISLRDRLIKDPNLRSHGAGNRERILRLSMRSVQAYCANENISKIFEPKGRIYALPS